MSPLVRCGLVAAVIVGAFAGGYFLKARPDPVSAADDPPAPKVAPVPPGGQAGTTRAVPVVSVTTRDTARAEGTAAAPETEAIPVLPEPPRADKIDPSDSGVQMIRKELGHKTTVLDRSDPVPAVLADAKKAAIRTTGGSEPEPMGGPMPRLESPPALGPAPVASDPATVRPVRLVNGRAVALDFEVTRAGSSKVTAVDLWTTRDGGTTWQKTDRMDGCKPPFRTRLGSDGAYGFKLAFESASGMRTPDPQPGQTPDLDLTLDATPPVVTLFPPKPGDRPGQVHIPWVMTDTHLDAATVRCEYSSDGNEWLPVEGGPVRMTETGYGLDWTPPAGVPPHVLLRVTAKDKAGNAATATTADRVSIDLVIPEGRVTGLRDENREPERGPMPRAVGERGPVGRLLLQGAVGGLVPPLLNLQFIPFGNPEREWNISGNESLPPAHLVNSIGKNSRANVLSAEVVVKARSPREWVEWVTGTEVIVEEPTPSVRRRDPFEVPAVGPELLPNPDGLINRLYSDESGWNHWCSRQDFAYTRPVVPPWGWVSDAHRRLARQYDRMFGERSLIGHLADPDWKPTTATAESIRTWEYEPHGVGDFWGSPGVGLLFQF